MRKILLFLLSMSWIPLYAMEYGEGIPLSFSSGQYTVGALGSCTAMDVSALGTFLNMDESIAEVTEEDVAGIIHNGAALYRRGLGGERFSFSPKDKEIFLAQALEEDPEFAGHIISEMAEFDYDAFINRVMTDKPDLYMQLAPAIFLACDMNLLDTYNKMVPPALRLRMAQKFGFFGFYQGLNYSGFSGEGIPDDLVSSYVMQHYPEQAENPDLEQLAAQDDFIRAWIDDKPYPSIDNLIDLFDEYPRIGAVYTVYPSSYAIGKHDDMYFVFDSHIGIDEPGSQLVVFGSKADFLAYLKESPKFAGVFSATIFLPENQES